MVFDISNLFLGGEEKKEKEATVHKSSTQSVELS